MDEPLNQAQSSAKTLIHISTRMKKVFKRNTAIYLQNGKKIVSHQLKGVECNENEDEGVRKNSL